MGPEHQGHDVMDGRSSKIDQPEPVIRERKISNINSIKDVEIPGEHHHPHLHHHHHHHQQHQNEMEKKGHDQVLDEHHHHPEKKTVQVRKSAQFLSAVAANMGAFSLGTVMAWSSTGLPSLRTSGDLGQISKPAEAWIGSIVPLAAFVSCPAAAYAMVTFGRRKSMLLLTAPFILGWLFIAFADVLPSVFPKLYTLLLGRVLTGFCGGAFSVIAPIFVAECSHEKLRGALASGFDLMLSIGMLYVYTIGAFASWQTQALACGVIPIFFHGLMLMVAESPRFLLEQGQVTEARQSLAWLFGFKDENLTTELAILVKSVEESQAKPISFDRVMLKMSVLKPMLICSAVMFFYTMCIYDAVIFYTVDIFKSTGTPLDPKESTIILGAVQVITTLPAAMIVDKAGRRLLLLISEVLLCLSLAAMGTFFYITHEDTPDNALHIQYGWLPLTSLNIFLIGYSIGVGPLALLLIGELVPSHIKGMTTCLALMVRWGLGFGVTNLFETMENTIGIDSTFWVFSLVCGVGVIFIYFCVPETRGQTLDDIQTGFIHKSKLRAMILNNNNSNSHLDNNLTMKHNGSLHSKE